MLTTYLQSLLAEGRSLNVQTRDGSNAMLELQSAVNQPDRDSRPATGPVKVVPVPAEIQRAHAVPPSGAVSK